jgi:hypothetical protein
MLVVATTILAALVRSTTAKDLSQDLASTRHLVDDADGFPCDDVITYVTDNAQLSFYLVNASEPFLSTGDRPCSPSPCMRISTRLRLP